MSNLCSCDAGKQNIQASSCPDLTKIARRLIIVPEFNQAGTKNTISTAAGVTISALTAKFDAADIDNRYFPLAKMENVENVRAETTFRSYNSGNKSRVEDGLRSFTGIIPFGDPILLGKIRSWACQKFGVLIIDKAGNFVYITDAATKLKVQPILVDENSFDAQLVTATDTEEQYIMVKFDFRRSQQDSLLRKIDAEDLNFDALEDIYSLLDANSTISSILTTAFTATIVDDYGLPVKGLVSGDFALYNVTDSASVTISTLTETSDGVYRFTFTAQTSADVLRLTPTKSGYDFTDVVATTITMP